MSTLVRTLLPMPLLASFLLLPSFAPADEVIRHPLPNGSSPISAAVEVPPGKTRVRLSGMVPPVIDRRCADPRCSGLGGRRQLTCRRRPCQ